MRKWSALLAITGCLVAAPGLAQNPDIGQGLYNQYCMSCHGDSGKGDGPLKEYLTLPPADLTQLARKNDGAYPMLKVLHIIDGRTGVRTHVSQMPTFGDVFTSESGAPAPRELQDVIATRGRILSIAMYIETLQQ